MDCGEALCYSKVVVEAWQDLQLNDEYDGCRINATSDPFNIDQCKGEMPILEWRFVYQTEDECVQDWLANGDPDGKSACQQRPLTLVDPSWKHPCDDPRAMCDTSQRSTFGY